MKIESIVCTVKDKLQEDAKKDGLVAFLKTSDASKLQKSKVP